MRDRRVPVEVTLGHLRFDHVVYDEEADVLYLSVGDVDEVARQVATVDGHLVRYDESGAVVGITFVNAKWLVEQDGRIEIPLNIGADQLAPALAGA